jgi:predicted ABC-class ATPase
MKNEIPPRTSTAPIPITTASVPFSPPPEVDVVTEVTGGAVWVGMGL